MNLWITNDAKCIGNIWTGFWRSCEGETSTGTTGSELVEILSIILHTRNKEYKGSFIQEPYLNRHMCDTEKNLNLKPFNSGVMKKTRGVVVVCVGRR